MARLLTFTAPAQPLHLKFSSFTALSICHRPRQSVHFFRHHTQRQFHPCRLSPFFMTVNINDGDIDDQSLTEQRIIPGTPCFTQSILSSPMSRTDRQIYLNQVTQSVDQFLYSSKTKTNTKPGSLIGQITLLLPQLNPNLDVYDRRFLLQLTWAVISSTVSTHALRTRVLIQGRRAFGAIPLSVAGLRRNFDADLQLSVDSWSQPIRSGDLEDINDLDDNDDVIIVISPTNAVSLPVITSVMDCVNRAKGRPVILINPRLQDVPSHSGVMNVSGRADRLQFLNSIQDIFYLRLLFDPGSSYPLRGILFHSYSDKWAVWRSFNVDEQFARILETDDKPSSSDITDAFSRDAYLREKAALAQFDGGLTSIDRIIFSPGFLASVLFITAALAIPYLRTSPMFSFMQIFNSSSP